MKTDAVRAWADDWADQFDQTFDEGKLSALVGKRVQMQRPKREDEEEDPRAFVGVVVGYSIDTLVTEESKVHRFSVLTSEGQQIALVPSMIIEELPEE